MCIRDSGRMLRIRGHRARSRRPPADAGLRDDRPRHRHEPCLLYTSDAADERSSVDLGGRRIIKKKNNTCQYTVNKAQ